MGYTFENWRHRLSERSDLSSSVTHLTRSTESRNILEQVFKILDDQKLIGSTTDSGFIVGKTPAVCFQDAPLHSIGQNVWFEQKYRKDNPSAKIRYYGAGFIFNKTIAYRKGARPVLYENTTTAKSLLPESEWWRIVNFNLASDENIIDWTHEREWRCPNEFKFNLNEVTLLVTNPTMYKMFINQCEERGLSHHKDIKGIVVLNELVF